MSTADQTAVEAEARYSSLFDRVPVGIYRTTPEGEILEANPALLELLDYPDLESFRRLRAEDLYVDPRERVVWKEQLEREGVLRRDALHLKRRNGSVICVQDSSRAVRNLDGRIIYYEGMLQDITEHKRTERRLEELVRSKDEFVASVSHEVRTPLTAVVGLAQELRDGWDGLSPQEARELVELVAAQAVEVANIVEDLLVAARADIGKIVVVPRELDVREQAVQVVSALPAAARRRVEVGDASARAWADPTRVRQVLRNLITNAVRYGGERIQVTVRQDEDRVRVVVCDDGRGIPQEDWERIFEPYYRLGWNEPASVGLGLTVSRQLARLMAGDLVYGYLDGRSVFELTLPAAEA